MDDFTVLKQIVDLASQFWPWLWSSNPWSENFGAETFHRLHRKMVMLNRDIGTDHPMLFWCDPQSEKGKLQRPYRLSDENSRRQDPEVQHLRFMMTMVPSLCFRINCYYKLLWSICLHSLVTPENKEEKPKEITHNVNDLLDHLIEESVALVGKPVPLMNKEIRLPFSS